MAASTSLRAFFGHQSVGADIVRGLGELNCAVPDIVETVTPGEHTTAWLLAHARLGINTDPMSKLRAFETLANSGALATMDVALFKFCYVDVTSRRQAVALYGPYEETMVRLTERHHGMRIAHCTIPLQSSPGGWRAALRTRWGRSGDTGARNEAREWFNDRLRARWHGGGRLFDLAREQSTRPDGTPATFVVNRKDVPSLQTELTDDGGHLNTHGRRRISGAFLQFLRTMETC